MRAIKRMYESTRGQGSPTAGLYGARDLQRKLVEAFFPLVGGNPPFFHEAQEVPIGTHIVKAVVVHADMTDVRCHYVYGLLSRRLQHGLLVGSIVLKDR